LGKIIMKMDWPMGRGHLRGGGKSGGRGALGCRDGERYFLIRKRGTMKRGNDEGVAKSTTMEGNEGGYTVL